MRYFSIPGAIIIEVEEILYSDFLAFFDYSEKAADYNVDTYKLSIEQLNLIYQYRYEFCHKIIQALF